MKKIARLCGWFLPILVLPSLRAQCSCVANTVTNPPAFSVLGNPAWAAGGTITDAGTLPGVCPREGCEPPRGCSHNLSVNIWVSYPSGLSPAPSLQVRLADLHSDLANASLWDMLPTSVTSGPGSTTLHYVFDAAIENACNRGTGSTGQNFTCIWKPPGGAAGSVESGSATLVCAGCGS
jgi:hypothetical protein